MLSKEEEKILLEIARYAINAYMNNVSKTTIERDMKSKYAIKGLLNENKGAFVTLKKQSELRGCIGYIEAIRPLYITVIENAINAGFSDPRFPPLSRNEMNNDLKIEISVLSRVFPLNSPEDIVIGRDGLIVKNGVFQGLLLPQVAVEHKWNKYEFLSYTCQKAGLPPNAWKGPDIEICYFKSHVFKE